MCGAASVPTGSNNESEVTTRQFHTVFRTVNSALFHVFCELCDDLLGCYYN